MDPINEAIEYLDSLEPGASFYWTEVAEKFGVVRSTLMQTRFSLASGAPHMHRATSYPAWGSLRAPSPSQEYSEKAAASARDLLTHHKVLLVSKLVYLFVILSVC
jgi:hypothetical protein